jgi:tRNA/tmRNA/rRNA uracil-C5-methylase (TrmA/RlmC/RlmD family)
MSDLGALEGAVLELAVGAVAHGGHFVSRADGRVVFVRHALPGEVVRARVTEERQGYLRADAIEIVSAAADRVEPPCPWAGADRCGGCDFQHIRLPVQRELKAAVVREQLIRLGGLSEAEASALEITVRALPDDDGLGWRTRVAYAVDFDGRAGLLKHRSHEVVAVDWCRIAHPLVRAASVDGSSVSGRTWDYDGVEVVASANEEVTVLGRTGRGRPAVVAGPSRVRQRAVGREWALPADAFWQVHPAAADTLATSVVSLLAPRESERAWDLYGGAGLFAAALAPHLGATGRLTVVESDPRAAGAAKRCLADLTTVTVIHSDVERALANPRWRSVDIVVLDPPRAGAGRRVVDAIIERSPRAVAYVACDPAAFARDVRTFREHGWALRSLEAYDLFPMTHHVECVALLEPGS